MKNSFSVLFTILFTGLLVTGKKAFAADPPSICDEPLAYSYESIADGDWSKSTTWKGGKVPSNGGTILITHNVTRSDFKPSSGTVVVIKNGGYLYTGQVEMENTSKFIIKSGKLRVKQNLQMKTSGASICGINACIIIDENFQLDAEKCKVYLESSSVDVGYNNSGNLQFKGDITGSDIRVRLHNGNLQKGGGTWAGSTISHYYVSGSIDGFSGLPKEDSKDDILNYMNTCEYKTLPVEIGAFTAVYTNDKLTVHWQTVTETNNSHFVIETSVDGKNFIKIGEVKSKAENGNSDKVINYEFKYPFPKAVTAVSIGMLAIGLGSGFKRAKRRNILFVIIAVLVFGGMLGCHKSEVVGAYRNENNFVRIVQVDNDGTETIFKVVVATQE